MYEIKTEDVCKDFNNDKETFDYSSYSTKYEYYDNPNKLVVGKCKIKQLVLRLKSLSG